VKIGVAIIAWYTTHMNKWSSSQSEELMKERKDTGCLDWYRYVNQDKRLVWEYSQKPKKTSTKTMQNSGQSKKFGT
jgi:hypothetical protein